MKADKNEYGHAHGKFTEYYLNSLTKYCDFMLIRETHYAIATPLPSQMLLT